MQSVIYFNLFNDVFGSSDYKASNEGITGQRSAWAEF
jgi:hypothetical protein